MGYLETCLADNPSLLWRLNETSGTTAADSSSGANPGTYGGAFTLNQTPATPYGDNAVLLSGSGVTSSYLAAVSGSQCTYEGWAYATSSPLQKCLLGGSTGTDPELYFDSATSLGWYPHNVSEAVWTGVWPGTSQWVYWALTWDDTAQTAELFINGVSQGQKSVAQSYSSPGNFAAGSGHGNLFVFPGMLAGYAVYPSILTASRISAHYAAALALAVPAFIPRRMPMGV